MILCNINEREIKMKINHSETKLEQRDYNECLKLFGESDIYKDAIFFDLEHYVYKKPICIGVFGCCYFDKGNNSLVVDQYMIENREDTSKIIFMAENYFEKCLEKLNKKYIVTFSGNNDFTMLKYLFEKMKVDFSVEEKFIHIDLQKEYEKEKKTCIGLKNLERIFEIERQGELISGSNLAKTISKIMRDKQYYHRMPKEKKEKILLYNEQDVVNLFHIFVNWNKYMAN